MIIPYIENSDVRQPYVWERNFPDLPNWKCLTIINNIQYDNILNVVTNIIVENKNNRFLSVQYSNEKLYIYTRDEITTNIIKDEDVVRYSPISKLEILDKFETLKNSVNLDPNYISLFDFYTLIRNIKKTFESSYPNNIMLEDYCFSYGGKKINSKDIFDLYILLIPENNSYMIINYYGCKLDIYIYSSFHFSIDEDGIQYFHCSDKDLKDFWINNDLAKKIYFKINSFPEILQPYLQNIRDKELKDKQYQITQNSLSSITRKLVKY